VSHGLFDQTGRLWLVLHYYNGQLVMKTSQGPRTFEADHYGIGLLLRMDQKGAVEIALQLSKGSARRSTVDNRITAATIEGRSSIVLALLSSAQELGVPLGDLRTDATRDRYPTDQTAIVRFGDDKPAGVTIPPVFIDDLVRLEDGGLCLHTRDGPGYPFPLRTDSAGTSQKITGDAVTCIDTPLF
jgi:hypothetical protein